MSSNEKISSDLGSGLLFSSNSYSSDTDGRWRDLVSYEWNPFFKLNK